MAGGIRIPLYQLPQQQLRSVPEVYQQARTAAADFGGDAGRSLMQAGDALGRVALARAARDNEAAARDIDNRFAGEVRNALHDPQRGYYATRGRAALDAREPAQAGIEALRKTYAGLAANPDQQHMLAAVLDRRVQGALQGIADHALREGTAWRSETRRVRIAGAVADGADAWHDPAASRRAFNTGREEVAAQAAEAALGPVQLAAALQEYDMRFHAAVIERQLAADPASARTYLGQVRDAIAPAAAARLDARVAEAQADRRAVMLAASYRPEAPLDAGAPGPGPEPRQAAYDAHALQDAGDDVAQRVRNGTAMRARFRRDHAAWRDRRASGIQAGYDWVDANPDEPVLAMPPQLRDGMDAPTLARVSAYADRGGRVATDWRRYQALQRFAVSDPAAFADYDLTEDKWMLAAPQLDALRKLQVQVREGDPGHQRAHLRQAMETVDDFLHEAGVTAEGAPAVALRQHFDEALAAFEHDKGRSADPTEMQAVFDRVALRGVTQRPSRR
jgi:hypothetical protein